MKIPSCDTNVAIASNVDTDQDRSIAWLAEVRNQTGCETGFRVTDWADCDGREGVGLSLVGPGLSCCKKYGSPAHLAEVSWNVMDYDLRVFKNQSPNITYHNPCGLVIYFVTFCCWWFTEKKNQLDRAARWASIDCRSEVKSPSALSPCWGRHLCSGLSIAWIEKNLNVYWI